jgi:hypothetical protein
MITKVISRAETRDFEIVFLRVQKKRVENGRFRDRCNMGKNLPQTDFKIEDRLLISLADLS